jgi:hypothetical protein
MPINMFFFVKNHCEPSFTDNPRITRDTDSVLTNLHKHYKKNRKPESYDITIILNLFIFSVTQIHIT